MSGIYVHIPFCKQKCTYCDFASYPHETGKADLYFGCLYREMKGRAESLKDYVFDTVYFGGGTPSFVEPKFIAGAMKQLKNYYRIDDDAEITIEMNPGTVTKEKVALYKKAGFNRFSIGLQSADDETLRKLNRIHTAEDFLGTTELLKEENVSADILVGLEDQTAEDVKKSIDLAIKGGVSHISMYALKPEEGTPMFGKYLNGDLPSEDETADLYDFGVNYLAENGFYRYEISNFAKPGFESKHNLNYWKRGQYIGFGVSASSFIGERRFTNTESIDEYTACILRNKVAEIFSEEIEGDERMFEYVMLAMRTAKGVNKKDFSEKFGVSFDERFQTALHDTAKYLDNTPETVSIRPEYLFVQNQIVIRFMD